MFCIAVVSGVICVAAGILATIRFVTVYRRLPESFPQHLGWDGELVGEAPRAHFIMLWLLFAVVWLSSVLSALAALVAAGDGPAHDATVTLTVLALMVFAVSSVVLLVNTTAVTQNAVGRPPTSLQRALFSWAFRCSLGVGLGVVFVMAEYAYRIAAAG
jgi:uncharacterized membrane protein